MSQRQRNEASELKPPPPLPPNALTKNNDG
jgi:hypothetical protein